LSAETNTSTSGCDCRNFGSRGINHRLANGTVVDTLTRRTPWVDWTTWLTSSGEGDLAAAGNLRFSQYDLLLQAAVSGQGVALGRSPLIDHALAEGQLVTPFPRRYDTPRGYFVLSSAAAEGRSEVGEFIAWLREEATRANAPGDVEASVAAAATASAGANAGASRTPSPKAKRRRSGAAGR
jgi:hypothetical protein